MKTTFTYHCSVCNDQLKKPPAFETHSLGTWNCPKHGPVPVSRKKHSVEGKAEEK
jgi:hypothetical protein